MKCKLLRMSLLCLLFLFTFCISVSFASISYTNFTLYNYNGDYQDMSDTLFKLCFNQSYNEFLNNISRTTDTSNFNSFLSDLNSNNFTNFYLYVSYNSTNASFGSNYNILGFYFGNNNFTGTVHKYGFNVSSSLDYRCSYSTSNGQSVNGNSANCYLYNGTDWYISKNSGYQPIVDRNLKFVASSFDTINLTFNGAAEDFVRYNFNQYTGNINLGNLENITGYREIQCNLYIMQANGSTFVYDNLGGFTYYSLYGLQNAFLTGVDHGTYLSVQVNQSKLYKNQAYILKATGYKSDNSSSETTTNIYFLSYGDNSSSGDPINPDAEDPSIDWNLINTFNNGIDGPSGNTEFINNFYLFPSGDSGDTLFGFKYNYNDYGLGLGNFILQFVSDFYNFTTNYDNVSMDFGFLGVISSSDFISPNNAFFTLISFIVNAILCLVIIRFVFKLYQNIATFDIDKFINDNEDFILF